MPSTTTRRRPRSDADATRARIVAVAERLFAERGIDAVSLIQIAKEADQRNRTAIQYHFGDKRGLLDAILAKHRPGIDADRGAMIDELDRSSEPALREVMRALVLPIARKLDDPDGGAAFLQVQAQLLGHPEFPLIEGARPPLGGTARLWTLAARLSGDDLPEALRVPTYLLIMGVLFHSIADYSRLEEQQSRSIASSSREAFVENLVDGLTAILAASPSDEARAAAARALRERSPRSSS